jgi:hypothetical protein
MNGNGDRGGASGLLRDQVELFGATPEHERRILLEAIRLLGATPVKKAPSHQEERTVFGEPAWYRERMAALSRAVWREQVTEREASLELGFQHRLMLAEMKRLKLWKRPRRGTGTLPPWLRRRPAERWRGWTCGECGGPLGPLTGMCAPCHFRGWWWP